MALGAGGGGLGGGSKLGGLMKGKLGAAFRDVRDVVKSAKKKGEWAPMEAVQEGQYEGGNPHD